MKVTLPKKSDAQLLAEIRDWLARGYNEAATERLQSIVAKRQSDAPFLLEALQLTCEALNSPKPKKSQGRPSKPVPPKSSNGVIDLDSATPMTHREKVRAAKASASDHAIAEAVDAELRRFELTGAFLEVATQRKLKEPDVRKAYYRVRDSRKP